MNLLMREQSGVNSYRDGTGHLEPKELSKGLPDLEQSMEQSEDEVSGDDEDDDARVFGWSTKTRVLNIAPRATSFTTTSTFSLVTSTSKNDTIRNSRDTLHPSSLSTVHRRASAHYRYHDNTQRHTSVAHTRTDNCSAYRANLKYQRIAYIGITYAHVTAHVGNAYIGTYIGTTA
ncbi:hypothetical protein BGZ92_009476 [Podila epicladia]|nr:hypothetical protein BGZ92_009476 [Podila epicladia]